MEVGTQTTDSKTKQDSKKEKRKRKWLAHFARIPLAPSPAITMAEEQEEQGGAVLPIPCRIPGCAHSADTKAEMRAHRREEHAGQRPFACPHAPCAYAARQRINLENHLRTHTGERPFKCPVEDCNFAGSQRSNLDNHSLTHTGSRPHPCPHPGCAYAAKQSGALKIHMRVHTGERPFGCDAPGCGFAAAQKVGLQLHKQRKH